ncbi:MAG: hypothetical protein GX901_03670 [Lentisphaerae bacterium]|mgnify:CR=1 FL=1|nr:hypothetical protein [Lentisphaerota bacterium]
MLNLLEQGFYLGLGVLSVSASKAEEAVKAVVAKASLSEEEGGKLSERLVAEGKKARDNFKAQVEEFLPKTKVVINTNENVEALEKRIAQLEAELNKLKK